MSRENARSALKRALLGACAGYLAAGLLVSAASGIWSEALRRYVYAWQGGRGETAVWGEPVFYGVMMLLLPGRWSIASAAAGAVAGALARGAGRARLLAASLITVVLLLFAGLVAVRRGPAGENVSGGLVAKDAGRAAELYRKACHLDDAASCFKLAGMYEQGEGVAFDGPRALALYRRACDGGSADGCYGLGYWSLHGLRGEPRDEAAAARAFDKGCGLDSGPSCFLLGNIIERTTRDFVRAAALYEKACGHRHGPGCQYLGDFYMHGEGVAMDPLRGQALYRQTAGMYDELCGRGDADNCYALALMYRSGQGVAQDEARALRLLERSCKSGSPQGCEAVKQARRGGN